MPVVEHTLGTVVANTMVQVTARVEGVLDVAHYQGRAVRQEGRFGFSRSTGAVFEAALASIARRVVARTEALLKNAQRDKQRQDTLNKLGATSGSKRAIRRPLRPRR